MTIIAVIGILFVMACGENDKPAEDAPTSPMTVEQVVADCMEGATRKNGFCLPKKGLEDLEKSDECDDGEVYFVTLSKCAPMPEAKTGEEFVCFDYPITVFENQPRSFVPRSFIGSCELFSDSEFQYFSPPTWWTHDPPDGEESERECISYRLDAPIRYTASACVVNPVADRDKLDIFERLDVFIL